MAPGVTYVYQSNAVPVYYPPPGAQWQQPPQGYAAMPYPQAAYGSPPPGQQPNPNYTYQQPQFQQPMQQLQQPPANPSQL
ncbi:hypothetical protein H4S07_004022 [Coemansia furcata]|uniref:Uncharacterized protein n=1 Tax=Coemansia furcata TaxID=417177 RepID=A0ACC1LBP2_9FUNG|nr:hypothetical protein H4S07_004022 [Coemansia furcata]